MSSSPALIKTDFSVLHKEIISAIVYFDYFRHPLTAAEISECICSVTDPAEMQIALKELVNLGIIKCQDSYFLLHSADIKNVNRRTQGEIFAQKILPRAFKTTKFISKFPFVDGVCISGSLSKNYFDENSDVDFFIVARPGRLWICRTLLIAFKKIFLFNSKKYFCVNYFIDSAHLNIPDQNRFTATEISFLRPMYNISAYKEFMKENAWVKNYFPNKNPVGEQECLPVKRRSIKSGMEKILSGSFGERLDNYFFRLTLKRWKKKFAHFNELDFDLNMRSRKTVSKHHPNGFQSKVMSAYELRLSELDRDFEIRK